MGVVFLISLAFSELCQSGWLIFLQFEIVVGFPLGLGIGMYGMLFCCEILVE